MEKEKYNISLINDKENDIKIEIAGNGGNITMIQIIKKIDSALLENQSIMKYLSQLKKYQIISEEISQDDGEINILFENELITIIYIKISGGKFLSIYRYHSDGTKYEQIDSILYDEIKENGYNRVIKFSGHEEDDNYSYITCSCFSYINNEYIRSWKKTRVVPIQDLDKIQYCKSMNLTELICMTESKSNNIIRKEDQKNIKPLVLKLEKL